MEYSKKFLDGVSPEIVKVAIGAITTGFLWNLSPQGSEAWQAVHDTLQEIWAAKQQKDEIVTEPSPAEQERMGVHL
jgi:hypothetical protein